MPKANTYFELFEDRLGSLYGGGFKREHRLWALLASRNEHVNMHSEFEGRHNVYVRINGSMSYDLGQRICSRIQQTVLHFP